MCVDFKIVKGDSRITSGSVLNGKAIAVNVLHGSGQIAVEAWVDKHGGDVKSVQWAEIPFAAMQAALDTDPAASVQAVAVLTKQDPAVVAKSARSIFGESVTPALVQPLIDAGARYGILKSRFPASDIIAQL